ncbi:fungal-specific transcription factor domain-containing protein [Sphaerosporella brunnea]|uniref:Fungal-specific transcription factor domain-containing protein n=1 Tax=Sphaerosporella brunnea TaxID=1250544 RepID=A0A5J5F4S9_9PEZI|nr:fungal-specific transcription factor domain-containing protein [Sphaerosporella brunnea]
MLNIHRPIGEDPRHPDLPGLELLRHLVDAYFSNIYSQTYAFLHRPSFEENWHKHPAVLLFSMCAVAARFSRCTKDQARIFEARARELIMQKYDDYSLEMVQSMVHMGLHDFGSNNGSKAWMFAGMAVRMGAALNMNLESRKKDKKKDAVIKECTRRTYWSYYLMDRFNSYGVARPFLTQDHDCHIQLPCNQPSFTEGKYVPTEHLLGPNPYNPAVGTKYMGAMAFLVRIVSIWGNILKQIHLGAFPTEPKDQPRRQMASQELTFFEEFIEKLENWRKSLPRGLEYSNENLAGQISVGTTGAFVTMHVMWHTAMAYVHRYVRTVGVPKDYIHENIQPEVIIESIRKAFVHADAVLQIMVHVRQQRDRAASRNESPVIVNAPFLGQAISDACNITIIRALEVRGEPGGAGEQRRRVRCGLEWLRELRRYWKPIEGMYQKLKKTYRDLDRNTTFTSSSAHMVPTPESVDSSLHPGSTYPVDPANYTAETFNSGSMTALGSEPIWHHFTDQFMAFGVDNGAYFGQAFDNSSHPVLSEYARNEGGFPHLYGEFSDEHMTAVSTSFSYDIASNPAMVAEMMPMQLDTSTVPPHDNTFELGDQELENSDDSDNEHEVDGGAGAEKSRDSINAIYFDAAAVQHGTLPDSGSEGSGHSRRASDVGVAVPSKPDNPMDLLHLINQENMDGISASLQSRQNEKDQFTGPNGAAAPMNNDLGGQPNLDNSGAEAHVL